MRTAYTCPLARSLPFVFSAMALACSATDEPGPTASQEHGSAVPDNADRGTSTGEGAPALDGSRDDATRGIDEVGRDGSSANDDANQGIAVGPDSDGDGLPDSVETNTKVFRNKNDTGTDPRIADTDEDGISDGDEVLPTKDGLDLAKMGTNPLHKDVLLEYDWFEDGSECAFHSHKPTTTTLAYVTDAFAAAPLGNPDGKTGIHVIHDYGQGGAFKGGNLIVTNDYTIDEGVNGKEYGNYRDKNFAANRKNYFHYVVMSHRYTWYDNVARVWKNDSSGEANLPGSNLIVSMYCFSDREHDVASAIVHELGHNLNLHHGGDNDINDKPNYGSVMNYKYTWSGVPSECTPNGSGVIDYSRKQNISLNEAALDENQGVCGYQPWDWNGNDVLESGISLDLNDDQTIGVLDDYDDWSAVRLDFRHPLEKRDDTPEIVSCDTHPPD